MQKDKQKDSITAWISDLFKGTDSVVVIGISGGKDSTIAAALCVEALGRERVVGVLMPQDKQPDIDVSYAVCEYLRIRQIEVNIGDTVAALGNEIESAGGIELNKAAHQNMPARIRMTTLYAVAAALNGRVVNTCNASETFVGWETKFGDAAGDFSPLGNLTVGEVKAIGYELGLPAEWIEKTPIDGLCGESDEEALGFSYAALDRYLIEGSINDEQIEAKILEMHRNSAHKRKPMPKYVGIYGVLNERA
jgi:NAD+ synthase